MDITNSNIKRHLVAVGAWLLLLATWASVLCLGQRESNTQAASIDQYGPLSIVTNYALPSPLRQIVFPNQSFRGY